MISTKSSLYKIGCLSRTHKVSSCWATTSHSISTKGILDTKNQELSENSHSLSGSNCYRCKAQATKQHMCELRSTRIQISRPDHTTGVDYAGPIALRLGTPRNKITKGYIAIFVCFMTKAVHIEVVTSSTTEAFLAALRRFTARRGKPNTIYIDSGTNF